METLVTHQSPAASATFPARRLWLLAAVTAGAGLALAAVSTVAHAPDWALLARQPWVIQLHIAAALLALLLGTVQLVGIKGTGVHRLIGWTWVVAMVTVAISSLFIRQINPGSFSLIHLLSGWTLIALPMALFAIRRGRVARHASGMTWTFVGGLIVAGAFTFLPGRLLWEVFFG
ncbi:DUF2306 domain-containing protein [Aquidulcibacter paucihalophilus]|jgi:uncharacterized membrane protein|nr:DUF2306 domain-containing protein [Aquidulcibacter paucihalophilus]